MTAYDATEYIALLPLAWLVRLWWRRELCDVAYWWLAVALAVSFVADHWAKALGVNLTGNIYPLLQASLVTLVLLESRMAIAWLAILTIAAAMVPLVTPPGEIDHLLSTVAGLGIVAMVYVHRDLPPMLRVALLVLFGLGWLAWDIGYAFAPSSEAYWLYQATRLAGVLCFCAAAADLRARPGGHLKLVGAR